MQYSLFSPDERVPRFLSNGTAGDDPAPDRPVMSGRDAYRTALFSGIPLLQTQLVCEYAFAFDERIRVTSPKDLHGVLQTYFRLKDREEFLVCLLDTSCSLIGLHVASVGGLAASIVEPRQVFKVAILANAAAILVAHNHPSENPEASREDVKVTKQLAEAGKIMGIPLYDHVICAGKSFTSLAEKGLI